VRAVRARLQVHVSLSAQMDALSKLMVPQVAGLAQPPAPAAGAPASSQLTGWRRITSVEFQEAPQGSCPGTPSAMPLSTHYRATFTRLDGKLLFRCLLLCKGSLSQQYQRRSKCLSRSLLRFRSSDFGSV
jgi:hypothetical protein